MGNPQAEDVGKSAVAHDRSRDIDLRLPGLWVRHEIGHLDMAAPDHPLHGVRFRRQPRPKWHRSVHEFLAS